MKPTEGVPVIRITLTIQGYYQASLNAAADEYLDVPRRVLLLPFYHPSNPSVSMLMLFNGDVCEATPHGSDTVQHYTYSIDTHRIIARGAVMGGCLLKPFLDRAAPTRHHASLWACRMGGFIFGGVRVPYLNCLVSRGVRIPRPGIVGPRQVAETILDLGGDVAVDPVSREVVPYRSPYTSFPPTGRGYIRLRRVAAKEAV